MSVKPNPVKANGIIEYELPETGTVDFSLFQSNGQLIAKYSDGLKTKGKHQLSINRLFKNDSSIKGTCFLQMKFKGKSMVQTLIFDK